MQELLDLSNTSDAKVLSSAQIKATYLVAQKPKPNPKMNPNVGRTDSMRERILKVSLFPDIYRK
jgi:hypothetical protein